MAEAIYEKKGSSLTVIPGRRLDTTTAPALESEIRQYLDGVTEMTIDFVNVEYISSSGLRMLLAGEQVMESRGGSMTLIHVNDHIMEIFEMVGFMSVVRVERD